MTILNLGLISPLKLRYPSWFDSHVAAFKDPTQKFDSWCPICREVIGVEAHEALKISEMRQWIPPTVLHFETTVQR